MMLSNVIYIYIYRENVNTFLSIYIILFTRIYHPVPSILTWTKLLNIYFFPRHLFPWSTATLRHQQLVGKRSPSTTVAHPAQTNITDDVIVCHVEFWQLAHIHKPIFFYSCQFIMRKNESCISGGSYTKVCWWCRKSRKIFKLIVTEINTF